MSPASGVDRPTVVGSASDEYDATAPVPDFAPGEPTDGREVGHWASRYESKEAKGAIRFEATYVFVSLAIYVVLICVVAADSVWSFSGLKKSAEMMLSPFVLAFLGGCLGGTLFAMKWLYHTVARGTWNRDRRLWRLFTPFLSGGAALSVILLCASGVLPIFGPAIVHTNAGALGVAVFLGYFSDRAFSGLERFAEQNLGAAKGRSTSSNAD